MLEVADQLSEAVHYESDRIEALAQAVSREWKSFDMNINQRSCLLACSVAYHKHSEEVNTDCKCMNSKYLTWEVLVVFVHLFCLFIVNNVICGFCVLLIPHIVHFCSVFVMELQKLVMCLQNPAVTDIFIVAFLMID